MPLDPNIAMSYKPVQIQDPMEMYGKRQQIQTNALAMQKYQTETAEKNALAQLISQPGYDPLKPEAQAAAFKVAPNLAPAMFKNLMETRSAGVDYDTKTQALATAKRIENTAKTLDAVKQIVSHNTVDSVKADVNRRVAAGELDQPHADAILSSLPQTDEGMPSWKDKTLYTLLTPQEQLERTTTNQDLGGTVRTTVAPKFAGGAAPVVSSTAKTLTPGEISAATTARRGQDISAATTRRGQNLQASAIGHVIKNPDGSSSLVSNQGKVVSTLTPAAGPKANDGRKMLGDTLDEIYGYYNTLKSQGGAASSQSGTLLGNIGAGVRGSIPGEAVESLMGTKAQTARDSIRMARPMIIASLKDALHLSAQQLNSNKELQLWLSAATDPSKSYEANMAALNNLARVANTGKIYAAPVPAAQAGAPRGGGVDTSNPLLK